MTKEEVRFQVALSCIQGVLEAKHGILGEVLPSLAVIESLRIADEFVKQWFGETTYLERQKPAEWALPEDFEEAVYKVVNFISPFESQEELRKTSHRFAEQLLSLAKKELDKPAEWSEEDENALEFLHELISFGFTEKFFDAQTAADMRKWLNTRLKSLHPQPHWKFGEYTLSLVKKVANGEMLTQVEQMAMETFYDDLKNL